MNWDKVACRDIPTLLGVLLFTLVFEHLHLKDIDRQTHLNA